METYRLRCCCMKLLPEVKGVIIDTNMFLVPYQFGVDILEEIRRILPQAEVYTVPQVVQELEKLRRGKLHEKLAARIAEKLLERVKILEVDRNKPTDTVLLELAKKGYVIATNDRELRRKVRESGGYTIYLRERSHLEFGQ